MTSELHDEFVRQLRDDLDGWADRHETILGRVGDVDEQLWSDRLQDLLFANTKRCATTFGRLTFVALSDGARREVRFRPEFMDPWLHATTRNIASAIVAGIAAELVDNERGDVFARLRDRVPFVATSVTTMAAGFGKHDGARAAGAGSKTWQVTSTNPRPSHATVDGETVPLGQRFSNGLRWPGDRSGGADETAGCTCDLTFTRSR